jgi:paxillin
MEKEGMAYCQEDYYNMFAPKCSVCDQSITSEVISALGTTFHQHCFKCASEGCETSLLESGSFYDYNGKPYCERHFHVLRGSLCATCEQPIVGKCLSALGKKFHLDHFVCVHCKKKLTVNSGSSAVPAFKERQGQPYCIPCHIRNFE